MAWLNPERKNYRGYSRAETKSSDPTNIEAGCAVVKPKNLNSNDSNLHVAQTLAAISRVMYAPNFVTADFMP
jgi:hypothetical protein